MPKNIKYSKSLPGRVGACILQHNQGPGQAQQTILEAAGLKVDTYQKKKQRAMDQKKKYNQARTIDPKHKARRRETDMNFVKTYKERKSVTKVTYKKSMLDVDSSSDEDSGIPEGRYVVLHTRPI